MDKLSSPDRLPAADVYSPIEIARRVEAASVKRARAPALTVLLLAVLGGAYIGFGGALATIVSTGLSEDVGLTRLVFGLAFSFGAVLLVICGGELFTGNNLMVLACASKKVTWQDVLRNWALVYPGNALGALAIAVAIYQSGVFDAQAFKANAVRIAETKAHLSWSSAFARGVLCNMLICLAGWLSMSARSLAGKVVSIIVPITAFVALGFEHCVADFYLFAVGEMNGAGVSLAAFVSVISAVTLGNIAGGMLISVAYYLAYLRDRDGPPDKVTLILPRSNIRPTVPMYRETMHAYPLARDDATQPMYAMSGSETKLA